MNCPKCGKELNDNQKFCTNCGAKQNISNLNIKNIFTKIKSHVLENIIHYKITCCLIIAIIVISNLIVYFYYSHLDLESVPLSENEYIFIDINGNKHFELNSDKSISFGNFTEGRVFKRESLPDTYSSFKENGKEYGSNIGKLQLLNHKGKLIKTFTNTVSLTRNDVGYDSDGYEIYPYVPEFYKGYARIAYTDKEKIQKLSDIKVMYINRKGNIVKDVPKEVEQAFKAGLRKAKQNIYTKELPCEDGTNETCIAFANKNGKLLTKAIYATAKKDYFSYYPYPFIYHDVTLAYINKDLKPVYIDKNGNLIYKDSFERGSDFNHLLADVSPKMDECDDYYDYYPSFMINKKGKRVWSDMTPLYIYDIKHKKWIDNKKKKPLIINICMIVSI